MAVRTYVYCSGSLDVRLVDQPSDGLGPPAVIKLGHSLFYRLTLEVFAYFTLAVEKWRRAALDCDEKRAVLSRLAELFELVKYVYPAWNDDSLEAMCRCSPRLPEPQWPLASQAKSARAGK